MFLKCCQLIVVSIGKMHTIQLHYYIFSEYKAC